jgi:hypothetical protein
MGRFKEILNEIALGDVPMTAKLPDQKFKSKGSKLISNAPSGHHIYRETSPHGGFTGFAAVHPVSKKIEMHVVGSTQKHSNGSETLKVTNLSGSKNSSIKAHELYHHLINHHNMIIHSDNSQSEGGLKTWRRLHKIPGVNVHKWDSGSQTASSTPRIGKGYTHAAPGDHSQWQRRNSTLVAHKPIGE